MFGLNNYKKALDKLYKKVLGKDYRDQMIKQNNDDLYSSLVDADKNQTGFEFCSTSHDVYSHKYKDFIKFLRSDSEQYVRKSNDFDNLIGSRLGAIVFFVMAAIISIMPLSLGMSQRFNGGFFVLSGIVFILLSVGGLFTKASYENDKKVHKNIKKGSYEKSRISNFFRKYKVALGLQENSLLVTHQTSDKVAMNRVDEVEYEAIQEVFLTAENEDVQFTNKYVAGEKQPEKTIIKTDVYKRAEVKILNLLMPDNTIFSIVSPSGPNGETVEELRDIIESRMLGKPVNGIHSSEFSDDKIKV